MHWAFLRSLPKLEVKLFEHHVSSRNRLVLCLPNHPKPAPSPFQTSTKPQLNPPSFRPHHLLARRKSGLLGKYIFLRLSGKVMFVNQICTWTLIKWDITNHIFWGQAHFSVGVLRLQVPGPKCGQLTPSKKPLQAATWRLCDHFGSGPSTYRSRSPPLVPSVAWTRPLLSRGVLLVFAPRGQREDFLMHHSFAPPKGR